MGPGGQLTVGQTALGFKFNQYGGLGLRRPPESRQIRRSHETVNTSPKPDRRGRTNEGTVKPLSAALTIVVLALIVQTAYIPTYCRNESHGVAQAVISIDRSLTREYCVASQVRDRNAPVSQWIDTLNYDLVALRDLLGGLFSQMGNNQQPHR